MFMTSDRGQIHIPEPLRLTDERCWQSVEMGLSLPLFFCSLRANTEHGWQDRIMITTLIGEISAIKERTHSESTLVDIQLLSPGWLNKSGTWKMDPLNSVKEACTSDGENWSLIYVLQSGEQYVEVTTGSDGFDMATMRTILACPRNQNSA